MKIVFLAAGTGSRIYDNIKSPKCLIKINKRTLIEKLILNVQKKYRKNIYVVTGFQSKKVIKKTRKYSVKYIHNYKYKQTEMLYSMYLALKKLNDDIIFSYTDIIYEKKIITNLHNNKYKEITVPINLNWKKIWRIRKKKILEDAETLKTNNGYIYEIGKKINKIKDVNGQYMGIFFIPKKMRKKILKIIEINKMIKNQITFFLNFLIQRKIKIKSLKYYGLWYEFDDYMDLKQFKKKINDK
jgi:choline kinase